MDNIITYKMSDNVSIDGDGFVVLSNSESQYSIWPSGKPIPAGWTCVRPAASKAECLAYVETHWTDLRPLSAR
jgi:MbtH protein